MCLAAEAWFDAVLVGGGFGYACAEGGKNLRDLKGKGVRA